MRIIKSEINYQNELNSISVGDSIFSIGFYSLIEVLLEIMSFKSCIMQKLRLLKVELWQIGMGW